MKKNTLVKRTLDIILAILLLFLMAYQVTGDLWHEWLGIAMTVLVIIHHILNRRWYTALLKGKYTAYRIVITVIDFLLLISFALAALTGISMSAYAVPFLNGLIPMMTAMKLHLGVSWWSFVLMSIHIGLHLRPVFAGLKVSERTKLIIKIVFAILGAAGIILLFFEDIPKYLAFRTHFATHLIGGPTILKNILMMFPWVTFGIYGYNWRKMIELKILGAENFPEIMAFDKLCFPTDCWKEEDMKGLLEEDRAIYYALMDGDKLVGDAFIYNWKGEHDYVKLMNLAVHPDYRGQGLAHKLLNHVTEEMVKDEMYRFCGETRSTNYGMQKVFEDCGYKLNRVEENYFDNPPESAYKYVLQIEDSQA